MKYILALLFPLCILQCKGEDKPTIVRNYAISKVGCGYVWGATGEILTESKLEYFYKLHPDKVDKSIVKKWLNMQVFDCAGLVYSSFKQVGIELAKGATSIWGNKSKFEKYGQIKTYPTDKVCILFRGDGSHMEHTGIYILNGEYVHAKGSKSGVLRENMSGSSWTHWALPKDFYPKEPVVEVCSSYPCEAKVGNASSGKANLRKGPSKSYSIVTKIANGETVTLKGYSDEWYELSYKNYNGYMMAEFIVKA